jgi:hypothetical protein
VAKRILLFLVGLTSAAAGLVALTYTFEGISDLKFFRDNWVGGALGVLVPGVLSASAFYMAIRLFKSSRAAHGSN